jgi:hypothetical protein
MLALLTLVGSAFLVSRKLSSDRPLSSASPSPSPIGVQAIEARLWEDPFAAWPRRGEGGRVSTATNAFTLQKQIAARSAEVGPLILPVMISGGPYSEDQEARIRSRFAIVAALGQRGYAPEDAEHLGAIQLPWPSSAQLQQDSSVFTASGENGEESSLRLIYEWYRPRTFHPRASADAEGRPVLVLWLDEGQFADNPLLRLASLLRPLLELPATDHSHAPPEVAVVGPRSSATLRAMLPREFGRKPLGETDPEWGWVTNVLQQTRLLITTASAIDEVLVDTTNSPAPRAAVREVLTNSFFKSVASFCATDGQIAAEVLHELALRGLDLSDSGNHLALISEWDSFYGRMLSLTYAAQLASAQREHLSPSQYINRYRQGEPVWPTNLHSFVFLRGLDGQTTTRAADQNPEGRERARAERPGSLEELSRWTPGVNKPEGRAQLDYLVRLGERLAGLDRDLHRRRNGRIGAIGIIGSDVYDTLLILQALRPRFPGAVFFTTELDARLWHQSEWEWSRNLVVVSSYGLELHPQYQQQIPPFRDSSQTALFAATLAALGDERLAAVGPIPPRRFEIGRFGPVDMSVTNAGSLQPVPPGMRGTSMPRPRWIVPLVLGCVCALALASLIFRPWIQLTRGRREYEAESLWLREEDIGGLEGFRNIQQHLEAQTDPLTKWMRNELGNWPVQQGSTELWIAPPGAAPDHGPQDATARLLKDQDQMQRFLDFLNGCLQRNRWVPAHVQETSNILGPSNKNRFRNWATEDAETGPFLARNTLAALRHNRQIADEVLDWMLRHSAVPTEEKEQKRIVSRADAARSARAAGWQKHQIRHGRCGAFWASAAAFAFAAMALGWCAWRDTFTTSIGEPFSLSEGVSAWPTEFLRFGALVLAVAFVVESYARMRMTVLDLVRSYRLTLAEFPGKLACCLPTTPVPEAVVQADHVWERYQQMGYWQNRLCRIALPLTAYFGFAICISQLGMLPHNPLRGPRIMAWDVLVLIPTVIAYLFLTFWTLDAVRLCRWFIEHLSQAPCRYPKATREFFSSLRGGTPGHLLDEWITLRLIAELTDRVGRLIYFPFIIFFILVAARNQWWDLWAWSAPLLIIFMLNLVLAAGGVFILQRAARRAQDLAVESLKSKLDRLRETIAVTDPQKAQNSLGQAERLLQEIQQLNTGAFAGLWENPLLGALLVPSGGSAIIEIARYLFGR